MIITFANAGRDPQDDGRALVRYLCDARTTKRVGGATVPLLRDPAPEILHGDPRLIQLDVASARHTRTYSSLVMSFEADDVDVAAFVDRAPAPRRAVDLALRLVMDTLWPGFPKRRRGPVLATTHTHTGRLEVNVATGCTLPVIVGMKRWWSYNPHPPGALARTLWSRLQNLLNARFGWADPLDPARIRPVRAPDWIEKQRADARRSGTMAHAVRAVRWWDALLGPDGRAPADRAAFLTRVYALVVAENLEMEEGAGALVLRAPGADVAEQLVLTGPLIDPAPSASASAPLALRRKVGRDRTDRPEAAFRAVWTRIARANAARYKISDHQLQRARGHMELSLDGLPRATGAARNSKALSEVRATAAPEQRRGENANLQTTVAKRNPDVAP